MLYTRIAKLEQIIKVAAADYTTWGSAYLERDSVTLGGWESTLTCKEQDLTPDPLQPPDVPDVNIP